MKQKFSILSLFLIFISVANAQLNVETDSYVYVKNTYLYVKEKVNLEEDGNIYLRNNAQLLQGTTGTSTNSGTGKISVIQKGNATQYAYNYWCSPVSTPTESEGNLPFYLTKTGSINDSISLIESTPAMFIGGFNGDSDPLKISLRWLYKYRPGTDYADWIFIGQANGSGYTEPGYGFTMKGTNIVGHRQPYDFRGRPNDGNIEVDIMADQETLIGNPYPSAIDLAAFLLDPDNSNKTTGSAMFWEHDLSVASHNTADYRGGYGVWVPDCSTLTDCGKGIYTPATYNSYDNNGNLVATGSLSINDYQGRRFTPIAQGFVVQGTVDNAHLTFKNAHRVFCEPNDTYSVFNRPATSNTDAPSGSGNETATTPTDDDNTLSIVMNNGGGTYTTTSYERPKYVFQVIVDETYTRDLMLCINDATSVGFDYGFDGESTSSLIKDAAFDINNKDYTIQSTAFNASELIPLHFKTDGTSSTFKILIGAYINVDTNQNVYVYDNLTNQYYLIDAATNYSFTTNETDITNRYYITFTNSPLSTEPVLENSSLAVYQSNTAKTLTVKNPDLFDIKSIALYNITGQTIFTKTDLSTLDTYSFNTSNLSTGVYLVNIRANNNQMITKKITIKN